MAGMAGLDEDKRRLVKYLFRNFKLLVPPLDFVVSSVERWGGQVGEGND